MEKKFINGMKVVVLSNTGGNSFKIGEVVTIENDNNQHSIMCRGKNGSYWYLSDREMELYIESYEIY